jgi:hypothetical protein
LIVATLFAHSSADQEFSFTGLGGGVGGDSLKLRAKGLGPIKSALCRDLSFDCEGSRTRDPAFCFVLYSANARKRKCRRRAAKESAIQSEAFLSAHYVNNVFSQLSLDTFNSMNIMNFKCEREREREREREIWDDRRDIFFE